MKPIYLDYNATTPVDPEVLAAMLPYLTEFYGNPSSGHKYGIEARAAIENAREQVADLLKCYPDEVVFTSGGTESNNMAIQGAAYANRDRGNHLIISAIEHPAVIEVAGYLQQNGFIVSVVPVDNNARVNPVDIESLIQPSTILISVMHANNETGTIQPIDEIAEIARKYNILFHTDAAQSVGKIPVNVTDLGVDLLSIAGHKLYAPKGIGALYIKRGVTLKKFTHGADHESNIRPGTENVSQIVGLGKACELINQNIGSYVASMKEARAHIARGLIRMIPDFKVNGHPDFCLPNTINISFKGIGAKTIIAYLDEVAVSAGAACHSSRGASGTLDAMNLPPEYSFGAIRISTGRFTTIEEADKAAELIAKAVISAQDHNYTYGKSSIEFAGINEISLKSEDPKFREFKSPEAKSAEGKELIADMSGRIGLSGVIDANGTDGIIISGVKPEEINEGIASSDNNQLFAKYKPGFRITQFDSGLGCGCKMKPADLEYILNNLPVNLPKDVLVGTETRDDAAVWKISDREAIVQTVDFFTPMVDDPYAFGAVAAANALSDIYAMGAKPLFALNLVTFPVEKLSLDVLRDIIQGASDKATEAGIPILGGHSIEDTGIKFGMVVTGKAEPEKIITNSGAQVSDILILTKPIGTGIITKALSKGLISADDVSVKECVHSMMTLNKQAAKVMLNYPVNACTDITGFGLTGHLHELLQASGTDAEIHFNNIRLFPEVDKFARMGILPGSSSSNEKYSHEWMESSLLNPYQVAILCDSQTSGGLLMSLQEKFVQPIMQEFTKAGIDAFIIGRITRKGEGKIICRY